MEEVPRARKPTLAAVRYQKDHEHQRQQDMAYKQSQARKLQRITLDKAPNTSDDESDSQYYSQDDVSSTGAPSEYSLRTPADFSSPEIDQVYIHSDASTTSCSRQAQNSSPVGKEDGVDGTIRRRPLSSVAPKMLASLTTMSDWNYDRFSAIIDSSPTVAIQESVSESDGESEEEDYEYSPLEVATPVLYTMPKGRPLMISIVSSVYRMPRRSLTTQGTRLSQDGGMFHRRVTSRSSTMDETRDGFLASEARPIEILDHTSRSQTASPVPSLRPDSRASTVSNVPKRKSSLPLLFSGSKSGHSRMSSIKNLIRSSTYGSVSPTSPLRNIQEEKSKSPNQQQHRPDLERSATGPLPAAYHQTRSGHPRIAKVPSQTFFVGEMTALPSQDERLSPLQYGGGRSSSPLQREFDPRPTPVRNLRERRGSSGQALRFADSKPNQLDYSAHPVPTLKIKTSTNALNSSYFPPTPAQTPLSPIGRMASYSPFPTVMDRRSSIVGLGLRTVRQGA